MTCYSIENANSFATVTQYRVVEHFKQLKTHYACNSEETIIEEFN